MSQIKVPVGVSGYIEKIEVLSARGDVLRELGGYCNLILDSGLARMVEAPGGANPSAPVGCTDYCYAGTGNSEPIASQTSLDNRVATSPRVTAASSNGSNLEEGYGFSTYTYTFSLGSIDNQNISELGIGWGTSDVNNTYARALVKDSSGNPTSITILPDEQLRVTWQLRRYWPTEDIVGTIVNSGNKGGVYEYTVRPAFVNLWRPGPPAANGLTFRGGNNDNSNYNNGVYSAPSELGSILEGPTGSRSHNSGWWASRPTEGYKSMGRCTLGLSVMNTANGIQCFYTGVLQGFSGGIAAYQAFQFRFDPPIMKTLEDILEIDFFLEPYRV